MRKPPLYLTALLLIGVLGSIIVFYKYNFSPDELETSSSPRRESTTQTSTHNNNRSQKPASNITWPRCQRNESASNVTGFNTFPDHIKNFLFYCHCRHFPVLLNVPDKCGGPQKSSDVFLLLVIKTSPWNYDRREVLRKTWAQERLQNGAWVRRIFLTGTTSTGIEKSKMNKLLELEHNEYYDILQWDFSDSFFNLTLKQVLFLEWMDRNCPNVRFLLNGDDDVFANTDNMVEYLQSLSDNDGSKHLYTGKLINNEFPPSRDVKSKYYVPIQIYELEKFPPYCGGGGILLSGFTAMVMYNMSHSIPLMPIDDVYLGMCLEKAGLEAMSHIGVLTFGLEIPYPSNPCYYTEILLVHKFETHELYRMWQEIHDPNLKCSVGQGS